MQNMITMKSILKERINSIEKFQEKMKEDLKGLQPIESDVDEQFAKNTLAFKNEAEKALVFMEDYLKELVAFIQKGAFSFEVYKRELGSLDNRFYETMQSIQKIEQELQSK
ncbi:hypothetical protein PP175_28095 (plasmid) [Aneurinibacillus sp. Ricciae_BoGa-3]|uniref:hypothetical protein n=1 Tax=Aneurinibacillus sp. Ricciae_BoGa-3 TaxID=3022697 RepID=UPI002341C7B6|nr:hypothetical protein [Aneurinibacillus sp. Ricciae_BoGa-3]WCK57053.1 hypothetical protein PP175_28095 [Aneurinibacillus sp. Ricciae_BoGa-3]